MAKCTHSMTPRGTVNIGGQSHFKYKCEYCPYEQYAPQTGIFGGRIKADAGMPVVNVRRRCLVTLVLLTRLGLDGPLASHAAQLAHRHRHVIRGGLGALALWLVHRWPAGPVAPPQGR